MQILSSEVNNEKIRHLDLLKVEQTPYVMALIIQGKYETFSKLNEYTFDDYVKLAEIVLVSEINQAKINNANKTT